MNKKFFWGSLSFLSMGMLGCDISYDAETNSFKKFECRSDSTDYPLVEWVCFDEAGTLREIYYEENGSRIWSFRRYSEDGDLTDYEMYNYEGELISWSQYQDSIFLKGKGEPLAFVSHDDTLFVGDTLSIFLYCASPPGSDILFEINKANGMGFLQKAFHHNRYDFLKVQKIIIPDTFGEVELHFKMWDRKGMFKDTAMFVSGITVLGD